MSFGYGKTGWLKGHAKSSTAFIPCEDSSTPHDFLHVVGLLIAISDQYLLYTESGFNSLPVGFMSSGTEIISVPEKYDYIMALFFFTFNFIVLYFL